MAEQHVLVVEHADPGVAAAAGEPEQVLGVVVAQHRHLRRGDSGARAAVGAARRIGGEVGRDGAPVAAGRYHSGTSRTSRIRKAMS